jgi:hypothetical protein
MDRKHTPSEIETAVLLKSARRCTLCFHLRQDLTEKNGQIAHLDQDPSNFAEDNLAFMCLEHHSIYDSKTSQHKNFTLAEVKEARSRLYAEIEKRRQAGGIDDGSQLEAVFVEISALAVGTASWSHGQDLLLKYAVDRTDGRVQITPQMGYIASFNSGGPITQLDYITPSYCPFGWDFPQIDFKILNREKKPFYLSEVVFDVQQSRPDVNLLFAIKRDQQRSNAGLFNLVNEGDADIRGLSIDFHLTPGTNLNPPNFDPPFEHHLALEVLGDRAELDVTGAFRKEGVAIDDLIRLSQADWSPDGDSLLLPASNGNEERLTQSELEDRYKRALEPFPDEVGTMSGVISFESGAEPTSRDSVKFHAEVFLSNLNRKGLNRPPSYTYDCALEIDKSDYQKRVQISQTLQPGEADRFTIKIATARSSWHSFKVKVRDVSGVAFDSPIIELRLFVPRSRQKAIEGKIQLA